MTKPHSKQQVFTFSKDKTDKESAQCSDPINVPIEPACIEVPGTSRSTKDLINIAFWFTKTAGGPERAKLLIDIVQTASIKLN